ncbi:hypothetical protein ABPG72_019868 [Tetrahymena utriculariae]
MQPSQKSSELQQSFGYSLTGYTFCQKFCNKQNCNLKNIWVLVTPLHFKFILIEVTIPRNKILFDSGQNNFSKTLTRQIQKFQQNYDWKELFDIKILNSKKEKIIVKRRRQQQKENLQGEFYIEYEESQFQ